MIWRCQTSTCSHTSLEHRVLDFKCNSFLSVVIINVYVVVFNVL